MYKNNLLTLNLIFIFFTLFCTYIFSQIFTNQISPKSFGLTTFVSLAH